MKDKFYNITIALAGIVQAVSLVRDLAHTAKTDDKAFSTCIHSIFQTDAPHITAVYGDLADIKLGLEKLITLFDSTTSPMMMRYVLTIVHLQKKIARSSTLMDTLTKRIHQTQHQVDYFHLTHPTVIANLADIYLKTISPLRFKIIIWGSQRILRINENMEKIRALLLAGIRSAFLWRQMGGSRFQLIFSRYKIKKTAEAILAELN